MATRTLTQSAANLAKGEALHVYGELINDLVALANEIRADHASLRTSLQKAIQNAILQDPGLRIDGGSGSPTAEAELAFRFIADGTLGLVAAGTNMPALAGTVTNGEFGVYAWTIDSAGTITQATLATGASLGAITFPTLPDDEALIGFLIVNPTGTGNFVGGTTDIDDATVVPNAVFIDGHVIGSGLDPAASAVPAALSAAAVDDISFRPTGAP